MIIEKDGKFFEKVEVEKEISELEYLRRKIKELEEKVSRLEARPDYIPYIPYPVYPYNEPLQVTYGTCTGDPSPDQLPFTVTCHKCSL